MTQLCGVEFYRLYLTLIVPFFQNPGGLLVDLGVLSLKEDVIPRELYPDPSSRIPWLAPSHPAIIEWRAMTVIELYVRPSIRLKVIF